MKGQDAALARPLMDSSIFSRPFMDMFYLRGREAYVFSKMKNLKNR